MAVLLLSNGSAYAARLSARPVAAFTAQPPARPDLVDLGRAPAATPVYLAIMLKYRNQAELDQLVFLQAAPHSPLFHHFITRTQFAAEFAPAPADYLRVVQVLRAAGFAVRPGLANRTIVDADGTAVGAERLFGTQIHRVWQTGYGIRYANATPATVPVVLADVVRSVAGLDDVIKSKSMRASAVNDFATPFASDAASPDISGPIERTIGGAFAGLYPTAIAKAYDYPAQHGFTGVGHSIAIVMDSDIRDSDLTTFWKAAGITRKGHFKRVVVEGTNQGEGENPGVGDDTSETAIDTELSSSLAPGADVYLYLIPYLDDPVEEDAYNRAVADNVVDVTSSSFGRCETTDQGYADATNAIAEQGASEGMSFLAATGDSGGLCQLAKSLYETDVISVPAADPYFLAIGGTALTVSRITGKWLSETAWNPGGKNGGGGGGVSSYIPVPTYQMGVPGIAVVPLAGPVPGFDGRNVPDISLDASNHPDSDVAIYCTGYPRGDPPICSGWTHSGGTSVSSPMVAALLAEVNQEQGSYSGWFNPTLYYQYAAYGYGTALRDITSGTTGAGWSAKAGYDQSTGLGSIKSGEMLARLAAATITEYPTLTANSGPEGITAGPDGAIWFTEYSSNRIGRITSGGAITEYTVPTANAGPFGITAGPDGALWFTEYNSLKIGRITTAGTITDYAIPTRYGAPHSIIVGPDGALWFTEDYEDMIARITTAGTITARYNVPGLGANGITAGPDGAIWFTADFMIGRIATGGTITEYPLATNSFPGGITLGPDGALWFTEANTPQNALHKIGRLTTGGTLTEYTLQSASEPGAITAGPDGALWFTYGNSDIGRITTDGTITQYPLPTANSQPDDIAAGPGGTLWFTEDSTDASKVGQIVLP